MRMNPMLRAVYRDDKSFFDLNPDFYVTNHIVPEYDVCEIFGECENRCVFCNTPEPGISISDSAAAPMRKQKILLCSGEPANIDNIHETIRSLKNTYSVVAMTTNGRKMKDVEFTESLLKSGLNEILFSLHGPTPGIHDRLTRSKGSFAESLRGIKHTLRIMRSHRYRINIGMVLVLTKSNLHSLYDYLLLVNKLKIKFVNFNTLIPFAFGKTAFKKEMPRYTDIVRHLDALMHKCRENRALHDMRVFVSKIPLCMVRDKSVTFLLSHAREFEQLRYAGSRSMCRNCAFNSCCEGIFEDYVQLYGMDEFAHAAEIPFSVL
jgi:MoaA/NifB/PqqE/SkfB family radical SAM enzyme